MNVHIRVVVGSWKSLVFTTQYDNCDTHCAATMLIPKCQNDPFSFHFGHPRT